MNSDFKDIVSQSVQYVKSVGPKRAESFTKVGIHTVRDLLYFFPSRHLDRSTVLTAARAFGYLMNGYDGEVTVIGKVVDKEARRFGKREILKVQFRDTTGFFECVWFRGIKYFTSVFSEGDVFAISSKPEKSKYGALQFVHPDFDRFSEEEERGFLHTGKIIPFYKIPKELKSQNIGDFSLRKIISFAVENYADDLDETLTEDIKTKNGLIDLNEAIKNFHFPDSAEKLEAAKTRFKFEELFYLELIVALRKKNYQTRLSGNSMEIKSGLVPAFLKSLPFELTNAQAKVLGEIESDMLSERPMNRLLQGDVGCGKTIVSLIAMLIAVDNGYQAAIMSPTEILADQHAKRISELMKKLQKSFKEMEIRVSLLLGGQKKSERERKLREIELQEANIIVGTHALFEERVRYRNLGLVVIDEQHRFGVRQRALLQSKGRQPDVLIMSATPIPRTLSLTLYGDLDNSVIDEMPKNRIPIKTALRSDKKLPEIFKFIIDKSREGYQSFIVYPLVEESEKLELKAAETYYRELKSSYLKNLRVGLIHGRMSWQEKEEIMLLFLKKEFDVLVSTTVIEVGIDIPDANIILINDAHRFGLSQLHQLRGRVGRSNKQAYCILVTGDEISKYNSSEYLNLDYLSTTQLDKYKSAIRLQTMVKTNNGFEIAETDLKLRGPGDIFGVKQSGFPELKHADIINDTDLIVKAKKFAFEMISRDPSLESPAHKILKRNLKSNYQEKFRYSTIA